MKGGIGRRLILLAVAALLGAGVAPAQQSKKNQQLRSVHGIVTDMLENPLSKAVVQLKNKKTLQVKSFYTDEKGAYRFYGLDPDLDYELKAEYGTATAGPRTVSSFDSRREVVINFKLEVKK
ncbi:MAG: carboxypeptidase regulatory-like domain-containing protein [Acidobacteria bacterium]|nr:carboxypeptidase regulatory-like domain-containing protein [Acidobacteriota bacterium]